jgi:hypothetical protein
MLSMEELLVLTCVGPDGVQQRERVTSRMVQLI